MFDPKIGLPLDMRSVVDNVGTIAYPYIGQMFYDKSTKGFYYVDTLIDGGAGFTIKSIFLSESNALGNLTVGTLTANELFLLSDGLVKSEQAPIANALHTLAQLRPKEYLKHTVDGTSLKDAGFVAQDMLGNPYLNHLVRTDDMHVRYMPIIAYLVSAVQELSAQVEGLRSRCNCTHSFSDAGAASE